MKPKKEESDNEHKIDEIKSKKTKGGMIALTVMVSVIIAGAVTMVSWDFDGDKLPVGLIDQPKVEPVVEPKVEPVVNQEKEKLKVELQKTIDLIEEEPEFENTFKLNEDIIMNNTQITKVQVIPSKVHDMVLFIRDNPTLTNEEIDILLAYPVSVQLGIETEEQVEQVKQIMVKFIE